MFILHSSMAMNIAMNIVKNFLFVQQSQTLIIIF